MPESGKFETSNSGTPQKTSRLSSNEPIEEFEFNGKSYNSKKKVTCICPRCGGQHVMAFHWIGRGTPRKYCQTCKGASDG